MTKKYLLRFGTVLLVSIGLIGFLYKRQPSTPKEPTSNELESTQVQTDRPLTTKDPAPSSSVSQPIPSASPSAVLVSTDSIDDRIHTLEELGTRGDANSFQTIISELKSSEREVREAALSAVMQFGSQEAIPILKDIAAQTEDPREKVAILDAIDFLALPSVTEARKQQRATTNSVTTPSRIK